MIRKKITVCLCLLMLFVACENFPDGVESSNALLQIFPNPASNAFRIRVNNPSASEYRIQVFNTKAVVIFEERVLPGHEEYFDVYVRDEENGYFHVILITDSAVISKKALKV